MTTDATRDQEISLMEGARARHADRMAARLADRLVQEVLSQPAPGQQQTGYIRTDSVLRQCA